MKITYITHPDVIVDLSVPVARWRLSEKGRLRMSAMLSQTWVKEVSHIYSSTEQKALDGAKILSAHLGLTAMAREDLGENDRTSTGYLEQEAFLEHVRKFFASPDESIGGWEPAAVAQTRVVDAIKGIASIHDVDAHIAVIGHGGVGSLLLTSLLRRLVSMEQEQPGKTGGNYFVFDAADWSLVHGWRPIDG